MMKKISTVFLSETSICVFVLTIFSQPCFSSSLKSSNYLLPREIILVDLETSRELFPQKREIVQHNINIEDEESFYTQEIHSHPRNSSAWFLRALSRLKRGDKVGSISDFNIGIELKPDDSTAYLYRGSAYALLGDNDTAILDFNRSITINPNYAKPYLFRGIAHSKLGNKAGAISDYDQAIRIDPSLAEAYYNRGVVSYQLGNNKDAIMNYDQVIRIEPSFARAYYNRAIVHRDLGYTEDAITDLRKAIDLFESQSQFENYDRATELLKKMEGARPYF